MDNKCSVLIHLTHIIFCYVYALLGSPMAVMLFGTYVVWAICNVLVTNMEKRYCLSVLFPVFFLIFHTFEMSVITMRSGDVFEQSPLSIRDALIYASGSAGFFLNYVACHHFSERRREIMRARRALRGRRSSG